MAIGVYEKGKSVPARDLGCLGCQNLALLGVLKGMVEHDGEVWRLVRVGKVYSDEVRVRHAIFQVRKDGPFSGDRMVPGHNLKPRLRVRE